MQSFGGRSKSYENELASGVSDALAEMEQQATCKQVPGRSPGASS